MYDVCHALTTPVNLNSANEILVSSKLTAAAAPTTGNVLGCEAEDGLFEALRMP
jgi:hypothetical protein